MDTILSIILLLCAYPVSISCVPKQLSATETDGQYSVTIPMPAECCGGGGGCYILEPNTTTKKAFAKIHGMGSELSMTTRLTATFPPSNGTTFFMKIGPVDKRVFRRQYVGIYKLITSADDCSINNYFIGATTSTTTNSTTTTSTTTTSTTTTTTSTTTTTTTTTPPTTTTTTTTVNTCTHVVDHDGTAWKDTSALVTRKVACREHYLGNITRLCDKYGKWQTPFYNCTRKLFFDILNRFKNKTSKVTEAESDLYLDTLVRETSEDNVTLYANDLSSVMDILARLGDITTFSKENFTSAESKTKKFLAVTNSMINENNTATWQSLKDREAKGADNLIRTVDIWTRKLSTVFNDRATSIVQSKDNIYFQMESIGDVVRGVSFPNTNTVNTTNWMKKSMNQVVLPRTNVSKNNGGVIIVGLADELFSRLAIISQPCKLHTAYSAILYRNVSAILSPSLTNDVINSALMSFSVYPHTPQKMDPPVTLTLQIVDKKMLNRNPQCSFLDTPKRNDEFTGWSREGCITMPYTPTDDVVVCNCDHLTNFALLMAPQNIEQIDAYVDILGYMSVAGCSISIVALCVTMGIYIAFWGKIRGNRTIILFNLFIMLVCAYTLFLVGVDKTANQAGCTVISVLLHYFFSLVFLLMLAEGIDMGLMVTRPLMRKEYGLYFVVASHVSGAVIVGLTMAISQLKGYGNDKYCWLTVESGLVWVFLGEVILVVTINSFVMGIVVKQVISSRSVGENKKEVDGKLWKAVRSICILMPIMGVTWLFGIFSINEDTIVFQYLFVICNSLQGVLIFFCHCILYEKVRKAFTDWHHRRNHKKKTETDLKQQATQQTSLL